jgi:hypothetical protein
MNGKNIEKHLPGSFHVVIAVWGQKYTNLFIDVTLPSHLSPGNLPRFVTLGDQKTVYHICTTRADAPVIEGSTPFKRLGCLAETKIHLIDDIVNDPSNCKYLAMTKGQEIGLLEAVKEKGAAIVIGPHGVLSDGSLTRMREVALSGKRVLMWASFRAKAEAVSRILVDRYANLSEGILAISPRELVKLGCDYIHPASRHFFWDSGQFPNDGPATINWDLPGKGILMRCAHMGPMMVFPDTDAERFGDNTLDGGDYIYREFPNFDEIHIVRDSDEAFCLTMSFEDFIDPGTVPKEQPDILRILSWYGDRNVVSPYHLKFLQERLFMHFEDLDDSIQDIVTQSDRVVRSIITGLESHLLVDEAGRLTLNIRELNDRVDNLTRSNTGLRVQRRALIFESVATCLDLFNELHRSGDMEKAEEVLDRAFHLMIPLITVYRSADSKSLGMFTRLLGLCGDEEKKKSYLNEAGPDNRKILECMLNP